MKIIERDRFLANTTVENMKPVIAIQESSPKRHRASFCAAVCSPIPFVSGRGNPSVHNAHRRGLVGAINGEILSHMFRIPEARSSLKRVIYTKCRVRR